MEKKVVLITGASSGIGKACAKIFTKNGYSLILFARRFEKLTSLKNELLNINSTIEIEIHKVDIRNNIEIDNAFDNLSNEMKNNISILINNAGLALDRCSFENGKIDDWEQMIDTNLKGLLFISKKVIPLMKSKKDGHIVNLGSIAGKESYPGGNVYCASKAAVDSITKSMRIDLLPYNIKVSQIAPGAVETEFSLVRFKGDKETAEQVYKGFKPLSPDDIADIIFYVCNLPKHVCINDLIVTPTAQANSVFFNK